MRQFSSEYARACPSAATSTQECCEFTPLALRWLALIRQCREARPHRPPAGKIPSRRGADRHEEPPNTRWASERRELERSSSLCFLHWADSLPQDKLSPRGQAEARNLQHVHARGSKRPSRAASSRGRISSRRWKRREPPVREEAETAETSSADDISTVEELGDALGDRRATVARRGPPRARKRVRQ